MKVEMIKSYPFEFTYHRKNGLLGVRMAYDYARGKSSKEIAMIYDVSVATVLLHWKRVCREIFVVISRYYNEEFSQEGLSHLYKNKFKTPEGLALIENFYLCIERQYRENPETCFLDKEDLKSIAFEDKYIKQFELIKSRVQAKRLKMLEHINKDFDLIEKWLNELPRV